MRILYIGDIMGPMGIEAVTKFLPQVRKTKKIDSVIAQAENVSNGKGISPSDLQILKGLGINFFTGGNWTMFNSDIFSILKNPKEPINRPANYPVDTPGLRYKYLYTSKGKILMVSLLGQIVGRYASMSVDNPLLVIDDILKSESSTPKLTTIVNFHGDYSSEKKVIGYYLDGRVGAVIGDHWHIPTADAMVLPKGTAHITDVGMCGSLDSSLGVRLDVVINRWLNGTPNKNILEASGRMQFNAVIIDINEKNGLSRSIDQIQLIS